MGALARVLLLVAAAEPTPTSDPFEIEVYTADTVARGHLLAEQHANVTSDHGAHLTYEFIYGLVDWLELATYFATEVKTGTHDFAFAEWRLRVRPRTPDAWPVRASLNIESSWDEHGFLSLELRPIWTQSFWRLRLDVDPTFEFDREGTVDALPALKLALAVGGGFEVGLEYYGNLGPVDAPAPGAREWHQVFAALDVVRWSRVELNLAAGFGLTAATDPFTVKTIVGLQF
ncbi:MAG TPA: hypothetical protein VKN99_27690 [Polyangia bacterium]|nr:hypothetical protein [Polyangia bacterium]